MHLQIMQMRAMPNKCAETNGGHSRGNAETFQDPVDADRCTNIKVSRRTGMKTAGRDASSGRSNAGNMGHEPGDHGGQKRVSKQGITSKHTTMHIRSQAWQGRSHAKETKSELTHTKSTNGSHLRVAHFKKKRNQQTQMHMT